MSFNLSFRASASSFTVPMVRLGLGVLTELGLLGVEGSGLTGLPGLGDKEVTSECSEDGPLSISSDGRGAGEELSLVLLENEVSGGIF